MTPIPVTIVSRDDRSVGLYFNGMLQKREDTDVGFDIARIANGRPVQISVVESVYDGPFLEFLEDAGTWTS